MIIEMISTPATRQHKTERDILKLHIHLGEKQGKDVSELRAMMSVRYLFSIDGLYL